MWPSGQRVGPAMRRSRVRASLWPLAEFVLGPRQFESSAMLLNSQLVASRQVGVFNPVMFYLHYFFQNYFEGVSVN